MKLKNTIMAPAAAAAFRDYLQALPQYLYPQHLLSSLMWRVARIRRARIKDRLIGRFIRWYRVDMREAANPDPASYADFNSFFTRPLRPGARPLPGDAGEAVSPADGRISQFGPIRQGEMVQAKGRAYSVGELLAGAVHSAGHLAPFLDGQFITVYLSPRDYHRVHMPVAGRLREMRYVPGRLFSVNAATARAVPRLFARNERVVFLFDTQTGPMALVMVGAIFVGSIETVWAGTITPARRRAVRVWRYDEGQHPELTFQRGQEIGRFNMGSTVIALFPPHSLAWDRSLYPGAPLRMGEAIGRSLAGNDR